MAPHVTQRYMLVSPGLATQWLANHLFDKQRAVRPYHVQRLANIIRRGAFRAGTPLSFAVLHGSKILINGQHTLHAIIETGVSLRLSIEEHVVSSNDDISRLYATFDTQYKRSAGDIYTAHAFGETYGLSKKAISSLSAAIPILIGGFLQSIRGKDHPANIYFSDIEARQDVMMEWADIARQYYATFIGDVPKPYATATNRALVASVGILTFRYQPTYARTFWRQVARRENLTATMPAYTLGRFLDASSAIQHREQFLYARYVASAWNAYYDDRHLTKLHARKKTLPIEIAGTPFTGKHPMGYFYDGKPHFEPKALDTPCDSDC